MKDGMMQSPSSKRKRTHSSLPEIKTLPVPAAGAADMDSPGTDVAHHLERLDMTPAAQTNIKKRLADGLDERPVQIAETPGAYDRSVTSRSLSPTPSLPLSHPRRFVLHPPRRVTSPPPPTPIASPLVEQDQSLGLPQAIQIAQEKLSSLRCDSPSTPDDPRPSELNSPASNTPASHTADRSLTWQESEITGHEIDMAADDDGEGINGIGFIPTPAMANKRSEWRRRQIVEWRARESKEARQRRYDKRKASHRDSAVSFDDRGDLKRRMVRFAEA